MTNLFILALTSVLQTVPLPTRINTVKLGLKKDTVQPNFRGTCRNIVQIHAVLMGS